MPTRMIHCTYCGLDGEIEIPGTEPGVLQSRVFTHHGHSLSACHMCYQCPACEKILRVNPQDLFGWARIEGIALPAARGFGLNRGSNKKSGMAILYDAISRFRHAKVNVKTGFYPVRFISRALKHARLT